MPKAYSIDLRQKIVDAYDRGDISQRGLAKQFGVATSFVQKLLKQRRDTGSIRPQFRRGQIPPKLNEEHRKVLAALVKANNDATLAQLCEQLEAEIGIRVSITTMHKTLKQMNFSLKKTFYPDVKATDRVQQARVEFWEKVRQILAQDLILIDESGINLAMRTTRARAEKGKRAYSSKPSKKGKNVSLVGALGLQGIIAHSSLIWATDGVTFEAFIYQKLVPQLWAGACVMMDNCSIHLGEMVRESIEAVGAKLIYLPPYSPDFSPIENCWSKVKNIMKCRAVGSYKELSEAIDEGFARVTPEDIKGWFPHCCYCTSEE